MQPNKLHFAAKTALALTMVLTPLTAFAEEGAAVPPTVDAAKRGPIGDELRIAGRGYEVLVPSAQISTEDGQISADLALDYAFAGKPVTVEGKGGTEVRGSFTNLSIKASIPLNRTDKSSTIDFKDFGNNAKLTVNVNHYSPRFPSPVQTDPYFERFGETCLIEQGASWAKKPQIEGGKLLTEREREDRVQAFLVAYRKGLEGIELWHEVIENVSELPAVGAFGSFASKQCAPRVGNRFGNDNELAVAYAAKTLSPLEFQAWHSANVKTAWTFYWGASASIGYNRFAIADRPTVAVNRTGRVGFDLNGRMGLVGSQGGTIFAIGGGYTRVYEGQDEVEICSAPSPSGATTCITGQDGVPDRTDTGYADVTLRQVLMRDDDGRPVLGFAPKATYIFEKKAVQINLPVFFQRNENGRLDAGVEAIWRSDTKKFGIGAFIGVPF